jgi:glycosyltransferase involved in cell wall biosynthesis
MSARTPLRSASVGLVHDYLLVLRGAERAFAAVSECFPEAPIYTLLYDEAGTDGRFARRTVRTSYLQRLRPGQANFRRLLPLYPHAVERLPVSSHDLIVSSTTAFAHGVRHRQDAKHVCYCHTPLRYAWFEEQRALAEVPRAMRPILRATLARSRRWDRKVARRVTHYIASSKLGQERIARYLEREATIVHPPVEVERFSVGEPEDYFLMVCELVRHKQVDVGLEAVRRVGAKARVVGTGPELERLRQRFAGTADFLGRVDDATVARLHRGALATIVPNVEEFGIVAVEAQAAGRPVLATDAGGVRETVIDGVTGVLVDPGNVDALAEALRETDWTAFDPQRARAQAMTFSPAAFRQRFSDEVARVAQPG